MKTRTISRLVVTALLVSSAPVAAQNPAVRAAAERITEAEVMRDASYLGSDALLGRASLAPGFDSAAAYIARELKRLGVTPAGDNGTYFQHYDLTTAVLDTAAIAFVVEGHQLRWGADYRVTAFLSPGVREGGVLYVGHGLRVPKRGIDPYAGHDIRGKWLLMHQQRGATRALSTDTLGILGVDYTTAQDEARSRGALGIITIAAVAEGVPAGRGGPPQGRDIVPSVGRAYAPYPLPLVSIARNAVVHLVGDASFAAQIVTADSTRQYPAATLLRNGAPLRANFVANVSTQRPYNVLGFIEGSDPQLKNEWISMAAHLDGAVGRGANTAGDSIFNAADDNASGSAGAMGVARALMQGPRPKRSVLMIWDSGEETGLWGARFIAYGPTSRPIVTHVNVDMIGRSRVPGTNILGEEQLTPPGVVYVTGPGVLSTQLDSVVARVRRWYNFIEFDRSTEDPDHESFYPRTDASPYIENGIPYIGVRNGRHGDYHRQTDEVSKLDPVKMAAASRAIYAMIWHTADDPIRPRMDKPMPRTLWFVTPR